MFAIIAELGWPIWPLILASILALALIIERAIALQRKKIVPATLLTDVIGIWKKRQITPDVLTKLEANSPLGRVLAAGAVVANRLTKNLTLLGSIGSIAPLLGLLGTVVGMIAIFASQQAGSNPQDLARGISVALYCTALGIIVAVPAVLAYRYFKRLVDDYLVDMEEQAERLLETVFAAAKPERAERA